MMLRDSIDDLDALISELTELRQELSHADLLGNDAAALEHSVRYLAWDLGRKNIRINAISAGPVRTLSAHGIAVHVHQHSLRIVGRLP